MSIDIPLKVNYKNNAAVYNRVIDYGVNGSVVDHRRARTRTLFVAQTRRGTYAKHLHLATMRPDYPLISNVIINEDIINCPSYLTWKRQRLRRHLFISLK